MRISTLVLLAISIMGIFSTRIAAQGGPPMITDDTETVPKGHWEINTAFTIERGADDRLFGTPLLDVNYGLSEHMQFKAEMPWLVLHRNGQSSVNGPGNLNIGIRWRFRDEKEHHRIAMSIYPQFEFNTLKASTNRGLVDKGPELFLPLQWQTRIGKFGLGGDAGYRFRRGADEVTYGVILGRELNERLEVMGEIHSSGVLRQLEESETVFNLGSRVKLTKHTKLLVSAGRSLRPGRDPQFIGYAGLQVNF